MIETIVLGILLFLLLVIIAVGVFILNRALARVQRNLRAMRATSDVQAKTFTEIGTALTSLSTLNTAVARELERGSALLVERWKAEDQAHIALVKAVEEFSAHAKVLEDLNAGLGRVAKAQVAAVVQIESAVRLYNKNSFGGAAPGQEWNFEESQTIKDLMQSGMTRQEAELQMGEQRADNSYQNFEITR